jgi:penicillin-binding protein 2
MAVNYRFVGREDLQYERRIKALVGLLFCALLLVLIRVGWLQLIEGERFLQLSQSSRLRLVPLINPRGLIRDRKGRIIADNKAFFSLGVVPRNLSQPEPILQRLKKVLPDLDIDKAKVKIQATKNPFRPVVLYEQIDLSKVTYLLEREQEFPSVVILTQPVRNYPPGELVASVVGYLGEVSKEELENFSMLRVEPGDLVGKIGVEKMYNSYLQGEKGGKQVEVDAYGRFLKTISQKDPLPGDTVYLTIDLEIQKIAYEEMEKRKGVVLIGNLHTGEILTMLSLPSFDPNLFTKGISDKKWSELSEHPGNPLENRAVRGEYPPASTFKIVLVTAALEEKKITPDATFFCSGSYQVGKRVFKCWKEEGHGSLNLKEALIHSCNVYFYQLGLKIGVEKIIHYARLFGLGEPTRIDLPSEKEGLLPSSQWKKKIYGEGWYPGDTANLSIGQGYILVTPIQMLNLISAVANGGNLFRPHLVKKIIDGKGNIIFQSSPERTGKIPTSSSTLNFLHQALRGVVEKGTGWRAKNKVVKIAGKTGTVKLAEEQNPHNWFVGYAPADNPTLSIVVLVENREEEISIAPQIAGKILSRVFKELSL